MRRREFLNVLAVGPLVGIAGCLSSKDLSLANFSEHDDLEVTFTGKVLQQPTDENPPRIELRFRNEGEKRTMYFGGVKPGTFPERTGTLVLIPDTREPIGSWDPNAPAEFVPDSQKDCWRALNTPVWGDYLEKTIIEAGEELTERYTLLAHANADNCFPPGEHRFEDTFKIHDYHSLYFDVVVP